MKKRRKGFFLICEIILLSVLFLLAGSLTGTLYVLLKEEEEQEMGQDARLIMQDVMERIKYNSLSRHRIPLPPEKGERNGRMYQWKLHEERKYINGVTMKRISCRVQIGAAVSEAELLLPPPKSDEKEGISSL